ncbi:hypothetical protein JCM9279_006321 [Rhodotorula babjevae]
MPAHDKHAQDPSHRSPPSAFEPGERTSRAQVLNSRINKPLPPPPDESLHRSVLAGRGSRRQKKEEKAAEQHPSASRSTSHRYGSNPSSSYTPRYVSLPTTGPHAMELTAVAGPVQRRRPDEVGTIPIALEGAEGNIPVMLDLTPEELDQHMTGGRGSRRTSAVERRRG